MKNYQKKKLLVFSFVSLLFILCSLFLCSEKEKKQISKNKPSSSTSTTKTTNIAKRHTFCDSDNNVNITIFKKWFRINSKKYKFCCGKSFLSIDLLNNFSTINNYIVKLEKTHNSFKLIRKSVISVPIDTAVGYVINYSFLKDNILYRSREYILKVRKAYYSILLESVEDDYRKSLPYFDEVVYTLTVSKEE